MPMFSPSCGSTRMTTGPASVTPDLVLSVPEPDISLHFLIQHLKILNQVPKDLIQHLSGGAIRLPGWQNFSSNIIGLVTSSRSRSKPQIRSPQAHHDLSLRALAFRIRCQSQAKLNLKAGSTARDIWGGVSMRSRWSLAIAGLILIVAGGLLAHLTQTSGGIQIKDVRFHGRQGQHHERPALHSAERDRPDPRARHPRGSRLHQFARDPGWLCHRIRPPRLCGARPRPDRPRL